MKSKNIIILAGMLLMLPVAAMAQQHIQQAFDALRQNKDQHEEWTEYSVEKDPATGRMEGLADVYDFLITNPRAKQLVTDIQHAFEQDGRDAYKVSRSSHNNAETYTSLAVGSSKTRGVAIGLMTGSTCIYACFLDPDDSLRRYRYAYALEWVDDGTKIRGRLAKTYATTQQYREGTNRQQWRSSITIDGNTFDLGGFENLAGGNTEKNTSERWLTKFNFYKNNFLKKPESTVANSYAMGIYKLCKEASVLDDVEKNMVATELVKLKQKTKDGFFQQLFDLAVERLKK